MSLPADKRILRIMNQVQGEGHEPGTPAFDRRVRARKVVLCQELHRVSTCTRCIAYDGCELIKAHLRDKSEAQWERKQAEIRRKKAEEEES